MPLALEIAAWMMSTGDEDLARSISWQTMDLVELMCQLALVLQR